MQSPLRWSEDGLWKLDYLNLEQIGAEELGAAAPSSTAEGTRPRPTFRDRAAA